MRSSTEGLARACSRHPWRTIGVWVVVLVLSVGAVATLLGDVLTGEAEVTSETDSNRANELVLERFPHDQAAVDEEITEVVVIRAEGGGVDDGAVRGRLAAFAEALGRAGATNVVTVEEDPELVSPDRDATAVLVGLGADPEDRIGGVVAEVERLDAEPRLVAHVTGEWTTEEDFGKLAQDDLRKGELFFGAPAALVILLLVFGAVVAGIVPLVLAIVSIVVAVALTALVGQAWSLSDFVVNMIFGMGLALGIDYALFILSRYREERGEGREKLDAVATAGATANRAVLFSGIAFVLAMFGLLLVPNTIMRSLAAGAILVGLTSIVAALTLLPAVLGLLGDRVNALRLPFFGRAAERGGAQESRFWIGVVGAVMRRPVVSLLLATGLLVAAAAPVLALETGSAGITTIPDRLETKQGFLLLNEEFPGQTVDPVEIVVDGEADSPTVRRGIERLEAELARNPLFGEPNGETNEAGNLTLITVPIAGDALSEEAVAAVRDLRGDAIPRAFAGGGARAYVTGETAEEIDYVDVMSKWMVPVFVFVLGLSFILLAVAFRSIVLPAKAIVLNLLSVGAAYGLLVLVFEKGYGDEVFGFQQVDTIEAWVPLFLFAVLFGLSMDYQVFLLSRIRERFSRTRSNENAIAFGVGSTARLITGAALIIIAVFSGFARGDLVMFQQMGFGVAVALLIDATIVRSVLVPASMTLLGRWNWYLPSWLAWLPDPHVEGREEAAAGPAPRAAPAAE
ncbi:MAG: MMPL family transporter [Thermoleophilia bacterium]|nr:MMPL family transporter [Thermoleophilia bacterium]